MEESKTKPVHVIRCGYISASIWRNECASRLFHDVSFSRCYRDGKGWASTGFFSTKDLPVLAKVILDSHAWIHAQVTGQEETISPQTQTSTSSE